MPRVNEVAATSGATSARIAHTVLRMALADAERAQIVPRNIARDARPPEHRRAVPASWSLADGRRFLERLRADGHRDEAPHTTAMTLGLRQGELLAGLERRRLDRLPPHGLGTIKLTGSTAVRASVRRRARPDGARSGSRRRWGRGSWARGRHRRIAEREAAGEA